MGPNGGPDSESAQVFHVEHPKMGTADSMGVTVWVRPCWGTSQHLRK